MARTICGFFRWIVTSAMLCAAAMTVACTSVTTCGDAVTVTVENDVFTGSDNNYTNGMGVSWSAGEARNYEPGDFRREWVEFWSFLPSVGDEDSRNYASWTLGQEMHTPDDISLEDPPEDDQPYAGVVFLDGTIQTRRARWAQFWNLRVGFVGPVSQAKELQQAFHDIIGSDEPKGWDTQLPNEFIVNVDYAAGGLLHRSTFGDNGELRIVPVFGGSVGTYHTGLSSALYGEVGWNLADAMGSVTLRHGFSAATTLGAQPVDGWSLSLFAGVSGHLVFHYLPLDGTVFRHSRSVGTKPWIGTASYGLNLRYRSLVFALGKSYATDAFDTQRHNGEYGTVSFSWFL